LKRNILFSGLCAGFTLLLVAGIVSGDYIGPRRTVTVEREVTIIKEISTDWWMCTVISWPPDFSAQGCSLDEFNYYNSHRGEYSFDSGTVQSSVTYPPATVSGSFTCASFGGGGYCTSAPAISLSGEEPLSDYSISSIEGPSGVLCPGASCSWEPPQGEGSLAFWADSTFGDTSEQGSVSYKVDTQPPVLGGIPAPDGSNGWYRNPMVITPSASDATSGVASAQVCIDGTCAPTGTLSEGNHSILLQAQDIAGNSAQSEPLLVQVDLTPPQFAALPAPDGQYGWFRSAVVLEPWASDGISGVADQQICMDGGCGSSVTLSEGIHTITRTALDSAGNSAPDEPVTVSVDLTPPTSLFTTPPEGSSVVSSGMVQLSGITTDALSGPAAAEISLDGGSSWQSLSLSSGQWGFSWDTRHVPDGTYPVYVRASDMAGNQENTAQVQVIVTHAPPRVSLQKYFWVNRAGSLSVTPNPLVPLASIHMTVSGGGKHPDFSSNLGSRAPNSVVWDGKWGDGSDTHAGDYSVTVTACDIYGNCGSDSGTILVAFILPPQPTPLPTATATPTATSVPQATPQPAIFVPSPLPTATPEPVGVVVEEQSPAPPLKIPWLSIVLVGMVGMIATTAIMDQRPQALSALASQLRKNKDLKKFNDKEKKHDV
jgi:hypothetical protein